MGGGIMINSHCDILLITCKNLSKTATLAIHAHRWHRNMSKTRESQIVLQTDPNFAVRNIAYIFPQFCLPIYSCSPALPHFTNSCDTEQPHSLGISGTKFIMVQMLTSNLFAVRNILVQISARSFCCVDCDWWRRWYEEACSRYKRQKASCF